MIELTVLLDPTAAVLEKHIDLIAAGRGAFLNLIAPTILSAPEPPGLLILHPSTPAITPPDHRQLAS